jgi:hypothetical protein
MTKNEEREMLHRALNESLTLIEMQGWNVTSVHQFPLQFRAAMGCEPGYREMYDAAHADPPTLARRYTALQVIAKCVGKLGYNESVTFALRDPYGNAGELRLWYLEAANPDVLHWHIDEMLAKSLA